MIGQTAHGLLADHQQRTHQAAEHQHAAPDVCSATGFLALGVGKGIAVAIVEFDVCHAHRGHLTRSVGQAPPGA